MSLVRPERISSTLENSREACLGRVPHLDDIPLLLLCTSTVHQQVRAQCQRVGRSATLPSSTVQPILHGTPVAIANAASADLRTRQN
jgi:hypothetical protein